MDAAEVGRTLTELDPSSGYFVFSSVLGFGFSLLGGYVCARMARRDERRLSVVLAVLVEAIGFVLGAATLGVALNALMLVLTFVTVMAGGELGRRRNLADARKTGAATAA
jgi:MFS family permease